MVVPHHTPGQTDQAYIPFLKGNDEQLNLLPGLYTIAVHCSITRDGQHSQSSHMIGKYVLNGDRKTWTEKPEEKQQTEEVEPTHSCRNDADMIRKLFQRINSCPSALGRDLCHRLYAYALP